MRSSWAISLQPLLVSQMLLFFHQLCDPSLDLFQYVLVSLVLGSSAWAQFSQPHQCWAEGKDPLPLPAGNTWPNTPWDTLASLPQCWFMINLLSTLIWFSLQSFFPASRLPAWKSFQSLKKKIRVTFTKWSKSSRRPPFRGALSVSHMLTTHRTKPAASYCCGCTGQGPRKCYFSFTLQSLTSCPVLKARYEEEKEKLLLITLDSARNWHKASFHWAAGEKIHTMASF